NNNGSIKLGGNNPYTTNYYYDDIAISSGQGPSVTPPANQTAVEGASANLNLGSFSDSTAGATSWTVDVNWGDGGAHTIFSTNSQGALTAQAHTYGEEGTYTVTVTVTDNVSGTGATTFQVTVSDPAVVATGVSFSAIAGAGLNSQPVATFTDPGGAEPNSADPAGGISAHYSATINWGDGTTS